jgi:hypothetical protein
VTRLSHRASLLRKPVTATAEPGGSTVLFQTSFETGDFTEFQSCQWTGRNDDCQSYNGTADYSASVTSFDGRPHVYRCEVRNGDIPPFGGNERAEIAEPATMGTIEEGDELWFAFDVQFPSTFPNPAAGSGWFIIFQWHDTTDGGGPPLTLDVDPGGILWLANEDDANWNWSEIGPITRGAWVRYIVHAKASTNPAIGFAEVFADGAVVLPKEFRKTMRDDGTSHYIKMGTYRDNVNVNTSVVYFDNLKITAP